jgi:3,4-dihydroxy 2-butanone 4-phosphate synthase / GTP cyclohydrolase II
MARLPDLIEFAKKNGLKIRTIAQMIEHRSQQEALVVLLVRVHESFAAIDLLDVGSGVALLLNCAETGEAMEADALETKPAHAASDTDLRTYGVGAQILDPSRRMPSPTGFGLRVVSFVAKPD